MKKRLIVIFVAALVLIVAAAAFYILYLQPLKEKESSGNQTVVYVVLTKDNFAQILSSNSFVRDLPSDAVISLRVDEDYYVIRKNSVAKGSADSPDFKLTLPGKYIPMLGDLCSALEIAKKNGDFGFETSMGKTSLLWKYKSMLKYRSCFGF